MGKFSSKNTLMCLKPPKERQAEIFSGLLGFFIKSRKGGNFSTNTDYNTVTQLNYKSLGLMQGSLGDAGHTERGGITNLVSYS